MGVIDKRKVKENEEKDAVLRIAVTVAVILLIIGIIVVVVKVLNPKADTQKGLQKLKHWRKRSGRQTRSGLVVRQARSLSMRL